LCEIGYLFERHICQLVVSFDLCERSYTRNNAIDLTRLNPAISVGDKLCSTLYCFLQASITAASGRLERLARMIPVPTHDII
jgi:hypothetical protein